MNLQPKKANRSGLSCILTRGVVLRTGVGIASAAFAALLAMVQSIAYAQPVSGPAASHSYSGQSTATGSRQSVQAGGTLDRLMTSVARPAPKEEKISYVREAILREAATNIGAEAGLHDRSCELIDMIGARSGLLDQQFRFNSMIIGRSMLPPVISEAREAILKDRSIMRIANRVYRIDQPAILVDHPPTWRDWLYTGFTSKSCDKPYEPPAQVSQVRPRNQLEKELYVRLMTAAYESGRKQAQTIFDRNLAELERAYHGMRRFFELYERGMVSAPVMVSETDVQALDDPNTMIVGSTVFQITKPSSFVKDAGKWRPLGVRD